MTVDQKPNLLFDFTESHFRFNDIKSGITIYPHNKFAREMSLYHAAEACVSDENQPNSCSFCREEVIFDWSNMHPSKNGMTLLEWEISISYQLLYQANFTAC
jgi:hypothetical protein